MKQGEAPPEVPQAFDEMAALAEVDPVGLEMVCSYWWDLLGKVLG